MNTLTQGAKRLPPKGRFREFEKPGSLKQALKDFKKLKMLQQHEFKLPGGVMYTEGQKLCTVHYCVAIIETSHSIHGIKLFILRLRNRSKLCFIRFLCLSIKIP